MICDKCGSKRASVHKSGLCYDCRKNTECTQCQAMYEFNSKAYNEARRSGRESRLCFKCRSKKT